jgi:cytochrome c
MKYLVALSTILFALTTGAAPSHAEGSVKEGARKYEIRCKACHTVEQGGADKVGPNLFGVIGAKAGKRAFAMKESGIIWNDETLDGFLEDPGKFLPGTKMPFVGFRKKSDRDDIIAYLRSATK